MKRCLLTKFFTESETEYNSWMLNFNPTYYYVKIGNANLHIIRTLHISSYLQKLNGYASV